MTLGPLEYSVFGFEGNNFDGSIAREIAKVVENGTIALVDVVFIGRDWDEFIASGERIDPGELHTRQAATQFDAVRRTERLRRRLWSGRYERHCAGQDIRRRRRHRQRNDPCRDHCSPGWSVHGRGGRGPQHDIPC